MCMNLILFAAIMHWAVDPMSTVQRLPDAVPTDGVSNATVRIVAARDEYEPASFVVRSDTDVRVQLTVSDFVNEKGERFPKENIDLKVVKVWYQNANAWNNYFADSGKKLVPELLLNDEDLITTDEKTKSNYAKLVDADGRVSRFWINPPRLFGEITGPMHWMKVPAFSCTRPDFHDAPTLQPVKLEKGKHRQFFLTAHVCANAPAGLYKGRIEIKADSSKLEAAIPAEIEVLPFVLPKPRAYADQSKEFLVSSYFNSPLGKGARRDKVLRNLIAHNQDMYIVRWHEFCPKDIGIFEDFKRTGMRTDVLMGFVQARESNKQPDLACVKRQAAAATRFFGHRNIYIVHGDEVTSDWLIPRRGTYSAYQDWGFKTFIAGGDMSFHKAGHIYDWFNVSAKPTSNGSSRLWNGVGDTTVAWYANQHVGPEDPSLNRRQNGLAAYLSGYTALCNYVHEGGGWNDDTKYYRPMVYAYGTGDGVVDTLQWEGFREGVDDIRYATALVALAREAAAKGDRATFQLGRRALQHLVEFDKVNGSLTACRAEMIRYIMALRTQLGHEAVLPAVAKRDVVEPVADIKDDLAADLAKAKDGVARSKVYAQYYFYDKAYQELEAADRWREAAEFSEDEKWPHPECAERCWRKILESPKSNGATLRCAVASMLRYDVRTALSREADAFGRGGASTNEFVTMLMNYYVKPRKYLYDEKFEAAAEILRMVRKGSAATGKPVPFAAWNYGLVSLLTKGDLKAAGALAAEALSDAGAKDWKPQERYRMALVKNVADGQAIPAALGRDCEPQPRLDELHDVSGYIMHAGDEATVRKLVAYGDTLVKTVSTKRYVVRYSPRRLEESADWAAAKAEVAAIDRKYGGSTELLYTDVATQRGGGDGPFWAPKNKDGEKLDVPRLSVMADDWGLRFRFEVTDEKADAIAMGLLGGDSWENYIAAGKDVAHTALIVQSGAKPTLDVFATNYDGPDYRNADKAVRPDWTSVRTAFEQDKVVTYLSLSWEMFALTLPKDGDVWDFESIRWARAGNNAWNGTETIHGRSTWGKLVFDLPAAARHAILRRQIVAASSAYKREKSPYANGCLEFWNDPLLGDPAFYAKCVKPIVDRLDACLPLVGPDMSDADVDKLAAEALNGWLTIRPTVAAERVKYLSCQ